MYRNRNLLMSAAAAVLALGLVFGVYELQLKQAEWQTSVRVVAPSAFIPAGASLSPGMFAYREVPAGSLPKGAVTDLAEVVGTEALMPLGEDEPLLDWKLDRYGLMPLPGQATFEIPVGYILSVSGGIRAGDRVVLYVSGAEGESRRLFADPVKVASVKTASNTEIDDPKDPHLLAMADGNKEKMYAARREANGAIHAINLNLSEKQWLAIDSLCKDGSSKLVVAYVAAPDPNGHAPGPQA